MSFVAIIFVAFLAINSGPSSALTDTKAGNLSEAVVGDYRIYSNGEAYDSCNRMKNMEDRMTNIENTLTNINGTLTIVKQSHANVENTLKTMEDRMTSVENTLNGTLAIVKESHANVENTLKSLEENISQMNTMFMSKPGYGYTTYFDAVYKGKNVRFSMDLRTAWRIKPTQDYGDYAAVVSNSILEEDQVFQIRIDETIEKWSDYGIGIGVMEEKKERIKLASNVYWDDYIKGTWAIYSNYESQPGKSNTFKDGSTKTENEYPLSTYHLPVGTIIGVSRRRDGSLHYYLNGVDKGAAFTNVTNGVYAFVDVIRYVTRISIIN